MIHIASDHAGFQKKAYVKEYLTYLGIDFVDDGAEVYTKGDDYPEYANTLCSRIKDDDKGILICDTGIGMSIAANRWHNIRAALCSGIFEAMRSREHNNANVLVFGAETVDDDTIKAMVKVFLETDFSTDERHIRRVAQLA